MGIIDKISDKLHGDSHGSSKNVDHYDTTNQQANRLDERTGTSTGSTTGTSNYGGANTNNNYNTSTSGTHSGRDTDVRQTAPVTQERVHDQNIHKDNLHRTDVHERTQVDQTVQPVYDQETRGTTHERVQHGTEVREHGNRGIGREAEAELARNREQIGHEHRNTHDQETFHTSNRSHGGVETRQHNIEEVVPVVERDVYRPHEIQHDKRVVDVHHDPTTVHGTHVKEPISAQEFQRSGQYNAGPNATGYNSTTGHHGGALEHGAERATGRDLNRDGNIGGSHNVGTTGTTGYNTSGVTGHNTTGTTGYNNTTGTTGYSNTSSTGNRGGALEHGAEKVTGRDLNHDGNVGGSHHVGSSDTTGYNTTGTSGYNNTSATTGYNNTTGTGSRGGALEHGAERATGRDFNHDGNVGNTGTTGYNNTTGTTGYNNTTSTTGYNTGATGTASHGTHSTSDAHTGKKSGGLGEKVGHLVEKVTHKDVDHDGDVAGKPVAGSTTASTTR